MKSTAIQSPATNASFVVEIAPFSLAAGIGEATLLAASERLENEVLKPMAGYRGRVLARKSERDWVDLVFWQDHAAAERMMEVARDSAICGAYFACMDMSGVTDPAAGVTHLSAVGVYGALRL